MKKTERKPDSLKNTIRRHDFLLALLMVISCVCGLLLNQLNVNRYNKILDRNLWLNNYMVALEDVRSTLHTTLYDGTETDAAVLGEAMLRLYQQGETLPSKINHKDMARSVTDLKYMTRTLLKQVGSAGRLGEAGYIDAAVPIYHRCEEIYELILEEYRNCNEELIAVNQVEQNISKTYSNLLLVCQTLLAVGMLVFSFWIIIQLTSRVVRPIEKLTSDVAETRVDHDVLSELSQSQSGIEEVYALTGAYNEMINRINRQFRKIKETEQLEKQLLEEEAKSLRIQNLLKASELKALQMKINPHFLFNSLNMITGLAYLEGAEQTVGVMELLGSYLRYNLDKFGKVVTIADEVENTREYLQIQKARMGERLNYEINMDPEARDGCIPCLILQPLVENSISHGLQNQIDGGSIVVNVCVEDKRVAIMIWDSGEGMGQEQVQKLLQIQYENPLGQDDSSSSIGVRNVISRLHLYFNGDVQVKIDSQPDCGTTFELYVPLRMEESINEIYNFGGG